MFDRTVTAVLGGIAWHLTGLVVTKVTLQQGCSEQVIFAGLREQSALALRSGNLVSVLLNLHWAMVSWRLALTGC